MLRANAQLLAEPANARAPRPHAATMEPLRSHTTQLHNGNIPAHAGIHNTQLHRPQAATLVRSLQCTAHQTTPTRQSQPTDVRTQKTATTHSCAHAEDSHNPQLCARKRQPQPTDVRTQKTATIHNPQLCARRRQPQRTAVRTQKTATSHSCAHAALGRMARYTYLIRSLRLQRRSEVGCAIHRHGGACTPQKWPTTI